MTTPADELVLRLAQEKGLLRDDQLAAARAAISAHVELDSTAPGVLEVLVSQGAWDEEQSARLLADAFGMATVDLSDVAVPADVLTLVPRAIAVRHRLFPFGRDGTTLRIAVSDPLDTDGADSLAHRLNLRVESFLAPAEAITRAIESGYGGEESSLDLLLTDLSRDGPTPAPEETSTSTALPDC